MSMATQCSHRDQIRDVVPNSDGCEDCLKTGDEWVKVRLCLTCGHTGCCDSSKNQHARKHFDEMQHPIIDSFEPENPWKWCYIDNMYLDKEEK
jgi:uncharacterized UBP type Zn finger protein